MAAMEAAGGILGLAALFNTAIDEINYVCIGKALESDFRNVLLDLESLALRLSRWGAAIGLDKVDETHQTLTIDHADDEVEHARELLENITKIFKDAEEKAAKSMKRAKAEETAKLDPEKDAPSGIVSIIKKMRQLILRRQGKPGLRRRTAWTLFRKTEMESLLAQLRGDVQDLTQLFPGASSASILLVEMDATALVGVNADDEAFRAAHRTFVRLDGELGAAVARALQRLGRGWVVGGGSITVAGEKRGVIASVISGGSIVFSHEPSSST